MTDKILIIDDDIDTLKLVGLMLERQGYLISVASNGGLGLEKAARDRPNLILLDVMMPDMDGYEVTRRLKSNPATASIPIIMFTAKTMVDDKVAGFEAGVDDYLTKPTHPAELTAHVRAVLARSGASRPAPQDSGQIVTFLGVRGGLGTTTVATNLGIALHQRGQDVIMAEINPGRGSNALDLNLAPAVGLTNLLSREPRDIHLRAIDGELVSHRSGLRLLLADHNPREEELEDAVPQIELLIDNLSSICDLLLIDLGAGLRPYTLPVLNKSDRVLIVLEPIYPRNKIAKTVFEELVQRGLVRHKSNLVLVTRERTSMGVPPKQIEADIGIDLAGIISPMPEQAHQASQGGNPLVVAYPDSLIANQIGTLADHLASHLRVVPG